MLKVAPLIVGLICGMALAASAPDLTFWDALALETVTSIPAVVVGAVVFRRDTRLRR